MSEHRRTATMSDKRRALLEELLREEGVGANRESIRPRREKGPVPLSFAQQRLWFLDQYEPGTTIYNIPVAVLLKGRLSLFGLRDGINEVFRRHEVLRTTFATTDDGPVQIIHECSSFEMPVTDLTRLTRKNRDASVDLILAGAARHSFDLSTGPLFVATLVRLEDDEYVLVATMHHIVSDGWSIKVFIGELGALYDEYCHGRESQLFEPAIQYADFAVWERARFSTAALRQQVDYWREQLDGGPDSLDLARDKPRPAFQTYNGEVITFAVPRGATEKLAELGRGNGATLFMALLAAFTAFLFRYTGQEDILVGVPIANRNRSETEGLIGFFVNTLVIRTDLSGGPSFGDLLKRVRTVALEAYAHQDVAFEKLVEELRPSRTLSHAPLFQVMFHLQNALTEPLQLSGVSLRLLEIDDRTSKFDLTLTMTETDWGLSARLSYNTDLFERTTIGRMASQFRILLDGIAADPGKRISQVRLLTEEEQHLVTRELNATAAEYPRAETVHGLFRLQAERRPHGIAATFGHQHLSYGELNGQADKLAHYLRETGVRRESLVGILTERSLEMIVGLLGILKAGGAYLPLEPQYPSKRLEFTIEDSGVRIVLTQERFVDRLREIGVKVAYLDRDSSIINRSLPRDPDDQSGPNSLAYVMYTSGSSGQPKGVEVLHRGVTRLLFGIGYADLDCEQVFLHAAPLGFDASTFEIWGALLHGGKCVLLDGDAPDADQLRESVRNHGVTTLWLTASLYNSIVDEDVQSVAGVGQLLIGGEALSARHVATGLRELSGTRIINGYGPTENTTFTCCFRLTNGVAAHARTVPIGRPIGNTQAYVLDREMNPAPIGVVGEIYAGGDGLARGYRARPQLTAERFVPNSDQDQHDPKPGSRLYRTGDLGRYGPGGVIEFVGRTDNQVKLRGYRIELEEIESALGRHPQVRECVVSLTDVAREKRLVAYIVGSRDSAPSTPELRSYLRDRLPEYMVPATFVRLEGLPLTASGKADRRALPAPAGERMNREKAFVPPGNAVEEVLAGMFSELLGVDPVGVHDDFFELGGHSLLATRLTMRVRKTFHIDLPVRRFFENPTVFRLARFVTSNEIRSGQAERIASILKGIGSLSSDQIQEMLKQKEEARSRSRNAGKS